MSATGLRRLADRARAQLAREIAPAGLRDKISGQGSRDWPKYERDAVGHGQTNSDGVTGVPAAAVSKVIGQCESLGAPMTTRSMSESASISR
jgi:hypothetical protein